MQKPECYGHYQKCKTEHCNFAFTCFSITEAKNDNEMPFEWTCPNCKHINKWKWDVYDIPCPGDAPVNMICEKCNFGTMMKAVMIPMYNNERAEKIDNAAREIAKHINASANDMNFPTREDRESFITDMLENITSNIGRKLDEFEAVHGKKSNNYKNNNR